MPRIKIEITGKLLTTISLPVRIRDINYGNHTGNDALVGLLQETRMQWLREYNYTELEIEGTGLIMSDLAIEFKNESFYADVLEIQLFVSGITKNTFELLYNVQTLREGMRIVIARARTTMVSFKYSEKKIDFLPFQLLKILS